MLVVKNLPANAGDIRDVSLIPGWGRSPGGGHGNPLQYSYLENPMDRGAWWASVHGVKKSQTWLKRLSMYAPTIYSPWNELKSLSLLNDYTVITDFVWLLSFVSAFSHFPNEVYSWAKVFLQTKGRWRPLCGCLSWEDCSTTPPPGNESPSQRGIKLSFVLYPLYPTL